MTKPFVQEDFNKLNENAFKRGVVLKNLDFCTLTDFGPDLDDIEAAFPSADIKNTLPMILKDYKQIYLAETEKYAHMTYFINGGYADRVSGEDRIQILSKKIMSYADAPEMKVYELTTMVKSLLTKRNYSFIAINFANPDMVGHTGNLKANIKAVEAVDKCLGMLVNAVLKKNGTLIVTADHGNAEKMIDLETDEVWSGHTTNSVPLIIVSNKKIKKLRTGVLGDIAPTIYDLLEIKNLPKELNNSLIEK